MFELKKLNKQPNSITMAEYSFSLIEQRIMYLIINQMDGGINLGEDLFRNKVFRIPIRALGDTNFNRVKEASKRLVEKKIIPADDANRYEEIRPFPKVVVQNGGYLEITMFADVLPMFMELKNGYTKYAIEAALSLKSTYSQRLYEMLSRFKDTGVWNKVSITDLRKKMGIEDEKYPQFGMFKKRILDQAQKEINSSTELMFTYRLHKSARQYSHVSFSIKSEGKKDLKDQIKTLIEKGDATLKCYDLLIKIGITREDYQVLILRDYLEEFWSWIHKWRQTTAEDRNKVLNPAGKLLTDLGITFAKARG